MNTATSAAAKDRPRDLFVTKATLHRRKAAPNLQAEAAAFRGLSKSLADDPCVAVRNLLESALGLCHAGSAGMSLLHEDDTGQPIVRWAAINGALAAHEGTDTPRDASPCGLCLETGTTIRVSRPERTFTSLRSTRPAIVEDLIVPLHDNAGKTLGTLWIAHHDRRSHFCSDDARIAEQLAAQLVLALSLLEQARERRYAVALFESHQLAEQNLLMHDLAEERDMRQHAETSESESRRALQFKDAMIREVNHRTKNTLQSAASLLALHADATSSAEVRLALLDSNARLHLLAKVHELLYTTTDNAQSVLMPELLQILGDGLRPSLARTLAQVRLEFTCDSISLPVDQAIPLVLLVNEVVTNAYKHAFPNEAQGEITVSLRRSLERELILRIADNGIGCQPTGGGVGMGLRLIRNFAAQLQGTLIFSTPVQGAGTAITLTISPSVQA
jgi:two-component sensor histidine kinase